MRKLLIAFLAAAGFAAAAQDEIDTDGMLDRLGSRSYEEREKARADLVKLLDRLPEGGKPAVRKLVEAVRQTQDRDVRETVQPILEKYAAGALIWESPQWAGFTHRKAEVFPEGIVEFGRSPEGGCVRMLDLLRGGTIWEKKPGDFPGRATWFRGGRDGVCVGGACEADKTAWFAVYDAKTGKTLRQHLLKGIGSPSSTTLDFHELGKDLVVTDLMVDEKQPDTGGLRLGRFKTDAGAAEWVADLPGLPLPIQVRNDVVLLGLVDAQTRSIRIRTVCLDAETGRKLWTQDLHPNAAAAAGDRVFLAANQTGPGLVCCDRTTGKISWTAALPAGVVPAVFVPAEAGLLVAVPSSGPEESGCIRSYDFKNGAIRWDLSKRFPGSVTGAALVAEGLLVAGAEPNGKGWMALVDPDTGKPLWEKKAGALGGKPAALKVQGKEIWLFGSAGEKKSAWVGVYALADGRTRSETPLASVYTGQNPKTLDFQVGPGDAVTFMRHPAGPPSAFRVFSLKSGEERWGKSCPEQLETVRILPEGLLVVGSTSGLSLYRLRAVWE